MDDTLTGDIGSERAARGDDSRNSVDISRKRTAVLCLFKIKI